MIDAAVFGIVGAGLHRASAVRAADAAGPQNAGAVGTYLIDRVRTGSRRRARRTRRQLANAVGANQPAFTGAIWRCQRAGGRAAHAAHAGQSRIDAGPRGVRAVARQRGTNPGGAPLTESTVLAALAARRASTHAGRADFGGHAKTAGMRPRASIRAVHRNTGTASARRICQAQTRGGVGIAHVGTGDARTCACNACLIGRAAARGRGRRAAVGGHRSGAHACGA